MPLMKTYIVCIVFMNGMFPWYTFFMTDTKMSPLSLEKKKKPLLVRFLVKLAMLPVWSVALANWFAWVPACTSAVVLVSLTRLHLKAKFNKTIILSWELSYIKQVEVLFPNEETIVRSIITYCKLKPSLSFRLFYGPQLQYIANQSGSAKETVSPKIGKNIEMLVCFTCKGTQDRILIDITNIYYY